MISLDLNGPLTVRAVLASEWARLRALANAPQPFGSATPARSAARVGERPLAEGTGRDRGPTELPSRARLGQADLVRAVATILVIVIHCAPWPSQASSSAASLYSGLSLISRVSVPLFVVLSGLLLAYGHRQEAAKGEFWRRRLRRTLLPWLFWAGVYFALTVQFQGMSPAPSASWGWWTGGAGHLFFLILVPQLYVLYMIWPKGRRSSVVALGVAVVVQVGLQLARVVLPIHGGLGQILFLDYGFEEAPFWVAYFGLGVVLGLHPGWLDLGGRLRWLAIPASIGAVILLFAGLPGRIATNWGPWVQGTGGFLRPSLLAVAGLVLFDLWAVAPLLMERGSAPVRRVVVGLSRQSLGIYIIHPMFPLGAGPLLEIAPRPLSLQEPLPCSLLPFSILVVGSAAFGWGLTRLLTRSKVTAWTVGESAQGRPGAQPPRVLSQGALGT